jgi:hypothetical protein
VWNASVSLSLFNRKITPVYPPQPQSGKLCTWLIYGILDSHRSLYEIVAFLKKKTRSIFRSGIPRTNMFFICKLIGHFSNSELWSTMEKKKGRAYILFLRVNYTTTLDN